MKILLAPDKFKGSLSAWEVSEAMSVGISNVDTGIEVIKHPLADGGEGTLTLIESLLNLEKVYLEVSGPLLRPIKTFYLSNKDVAFIEMSQASGLQLLEKAERNPLNTSTYGTGELIKHAIKSGAKQIYLSIGGSATNDAGIGMAKALGCVFKGARGIIEAINGQALGSIEDIDPGELEHLLANIEFTVLCDVDNPLYGPNGAAHVYAKQKGANETEIAALDEGLKHLANLLHNGLENVPGAGAAGGLGYGAMSFLDAELQSGIAFVMKVTRFEQRLQEVDLVITGEGRVDRQSLYGKVVAGVQKGAQKANVPMAIIAGDVVDRDTINETWSPFELVGLTNDRMTKAETIANAKTLLAQAAYDMMQRLPEHFFKK